MPALLAVLAACTGTTGGGTNDRAGASTPTAGAILVGGADRDGDDRPFAGCYDLSALVSLPGTGEGCLDGSDTLVPASARTGRVVDLLLGGAEVRIRKDEDGRRTVTLKGYERPDEFLILDPPDASRLPEPPRVAAVRKARPPRRPRPPPVVANAPSATPPALPMAPKPPPMAALVVEQIDEVPEPGAFLQLPVPRAVDPAPAQAQGSPTFRELMEDLARAATRMVCGPEGCTCPHPPCVPCPLAAQRLDGMSEDTWVVHWFVWYATEATSSERYLAIRSLTAEEADLVRRAKFRWGFATRMDASIGAWDWEAGRIPAGLVAGAGERLVTLKSRGARVIGSGPAPSGDLEGALGIATDRTAPPEARVHALRWLGQRGRREAVLSVLRDLAARDPDDSIRGVALDALDDLLARAP